jgi:hypothetical protein
LTDLLITAGSDHLIRTVYVTDSGFKPGKVILISGIVLDMHARVYRHADGTEDGQLVFCTEQGTIETIG